MRRDRCFRFQFMQFCYDHRKLHRRMCCVCRSLHEVIRILDNMGPKKKDCKEKGCNEKQRPYG